MRRASSFKFGRIGYTVSISKSAFLASKTSCVDHLVARLILVAFRARLILKTETALSSTLIGLEIVWLF